MYAAYWKGHLPCVIFLILEGKGRCLCARWSMSVICAGKRASKTISRGRIYVFQHSLQHRKHMGDLPSLFSLHLKLSDRQALAASQCGDVEPSASPTSHEGFQPSTRHLTNRLCVVPCFPIPSRLKRP
jgi:hypothetical protein